MSKAARAGKTRIYFLSWIIFRRRGKFESINFLYNERNYEKVRSLLVSAAIAACGVGVFLL